MGASYVTRTACSTLWERDALLQGRNGAYLLQRTVQRGCSLRGALGEVNSGTKARREYEERGSDYDTAEGMSSTSIV